MNKKILFTAVSIILAILMSFASVAVSAASDNPYPYDAKAGEEMGNSENPIKPAPVSTGNTIEKKVGDIDGDGIININDATEFQLILAGKKSVTEVFKLNGDALADTKKNVSDVTAIQFYAARVYTKLPVTADGYYAEIIRP